MKQLTAAAVHDDSNFVIPTPEEISKDVDVIFKSMGLTAADDSQVAAAVADNEWQLLQKLEDQELRQVAAAVDDTAAAAAKFGGESSSPLGMETAAASGAGASTN